MLVKSGLRLTAPCIAFVSAFATAAILGGCGDNRQGDGVSVEDGALNGELAVFVADDPEHDRSETQYALRTPNGVERRLHFETDPRLETGTPIKIWGTEMSDGLAVQTFKTMPKAPAGIIERITAPLKAGMTFAAKRFALIVVDIGGGVPAEWTLERAQNELTGPVTNANDPPTRSYYMEASYGTQDLDARAFVMSYPMTTCDTSGMSKTLKPMVMAQGGGSFNHYLWYMASNLKACAWSGLGEVGTPDKPADDTWYNASASCVVMVQEPGHNFGMQHSSSMSCPGAPFLDDLGTCTHSEYGDRYDPMGGGCRHMNGWQKAYNGWLQGCNVVEVKQSGQFTLVPMELGCDGVQLLKIPMPKTRMFMRSGGGGQATNEMLTHYYLELRTPKGVDTGMNMTTVLVHVSGNIRGRTQQAVHTWLLDMDQAATNQQGLVAGKSFSDPAGGVTFTVMAIDASHAEINVEMTATGGGPTCLGGAAFTAPGPGIESCNAAPTVPGNGGASGTGSGGAGGAGTGGRGTGGGGAGTGGRGGNGGIGTGGSATGGSGTATGGRGGTGGTATGGSNTGGSSSGGAPVTGTGGGITSSGGAPASSGGAPGVGTGGAGPATGSGGAPGSAGAPGITPPDVTGGCACSTTGGSPIAGTALGFGVMLLLGGVRKRRRK